MNKTVANASAVSLTTHSKTSSTTTLHGCPPYLTPGPLQASYIENFASKLNVPFPQRPQESVSILTC